MGLFQRFSNKSDEAGHKKANDNALGLSAVVFVTDSFSKTSGGRITSIFNRAKMASDMGRDVYIATLNLKPGYARIFAHLKKKFGATNAQFLNPYDFFCGNDLYGLASNLPTPNPAERGEGHSSIVADKNGNVYSRTYSLPNSEMAQQTIYYDPRTGDPYLISTSNLSGRGSSLTWLRAGKGEPCIFADWDDALAYWVSQIEKQLHRPIFLSEFHEKDHVFTKNPYVSERLNVIAMIHNTFFAKPYAYGSPINEYLGPVFDDMDLYSAIVFLTEQEKEHACNYYGPRDHMFCIANSISAQKVSGASKIPYSLVVCSRFAKIKRIEHVIKAMPRILEAVPDAVLFLYGGGDEEEALRTTSESLGLAGHVRFQGFTDEPLEAVSRCSLSVSTSRYEGFCISAVESLSVGTPVVSYDYLYGPQAWVKDGVNGVLVENGNIDALADAIVDIFTTPGKLDSMSEAAQDLDEKFTASFIAQQWSDAYSFVERNCQRESPSMRPVLLEASMEDCGIEPPQGGRSSGKITLHARRSPVTKPCDYYLSFNAQNRIGITDSLYAKGSIRHNANDLDTVEFELACTEGEFADLIGDGSGLGVFAVNGKRASLYPLSKNGQKMSSAGRERPSKVEQEILNARLSAALEVLVEPHDWSRKYVWRNCYTVWETKALFGGTVAFDICAKGDRITMNVAVRDESQLCALLTLLDRKEVPYVRKPESNKNVRLLSRQVNTDDAHEFTSIIRDVSAVINRVVSAG